MAWLGRLIVIFLAITLVAGCGSTTRPYAHDPLLLNGSGVRGDPSRTPERDHFAGPGPLPPRPPSPTSLATEADVERPLSGQVSLTSP